MTQLFKLSQRKIKRKLLTAIQKNMENPYITYESLFISAFKFKNGLVALKTYHIKPNPSLPQARHIPNFCFSTSLEG